MNNKIKINMLSTATKVSGQGVGSAYVEQTALVKANNDVFDVSVNARRGYFDIYHIHTPNPTYYLRMNKRHINVMYVHFIPETLDGSIKLPKPFFWIFKKYIIRLYKKADEIVVVNNSFIAPLVKLGISQDKITYIPNYVNKETFHPLERQTILQTRNQFNINPKKFTVLGCGQVQTRKGVKDFIEVAKKMPDIQFVWAGGFSFGVITDGHKELKAIMDNPPPNVKFIGIIERNKMNEIFNMADVLFMPSLTELFPMSVLEAANVNKPILLRDLELYHDILLDKYLKGSNVTDWVNEIYKLKTNRDYYQKASSNSRDIANFYSNERLSKLWRDYYLRIYDKYKYLLKSKK